MTAPKRPGKPGRRDTRPAPARGKPARDAEGATPRGAKPVRVRKDGSVASGEADARKARSEGRRPDAAAKPARGEGRPTRATTAAAGASSRTGRPRRDDRFIDGPSEVRSPRGEGRRPDFLARADRGRRDDAPIARSGGRPPRADGAASGRVRRDGSGATGPSEARTARSHGRQHPEASSRPAPVRRDGPATGGNRFEGRPARAVPGAPATGRPERPERPERPSRAGPATGGRAAFRAPRADTTRPAGAPAPRAEAPAAKPARVRKDGSVAAGGREEREARVRSTRYEKQEPQRIAKLLARAGIASRREIERMIVEGRIALDGVPLDTPATILTSLQGVTVDGAPVDAAEASRLFLFHKPTGLITAAFDPAGRPTIYDRLPPGLPRVIPVGRLDLNTEGLLLLTNDGELKRKLELPSTGIPRTYRARAYGEVTQEMLESLMDGVEIEGVRYGPIDANLERRTGRNVWIEIRITEGKNREVRRVLEYLGLQVSRLIRTAYGEFVLADLPAGEVVEVRQHDLEEFRKTIR